MGDCCQDYADTCLLTTTTSTTTTTPRPENVGSCEGQCGGPGLGCYCDSGCERAGDCCPDYLQQCQKPTSPAAPVLYYNTTCGVRGPPGKVVGGTETKRNDYTWMALLARSQAGSPRLKGSETVAELLRSHRPFCGGSLVSRDLVVTASHCTSGPTSPGKYVVVLGDWDRHSELDTFVTVHQVVERIRHPKYNPANFNHDIALWRISPPADLNHFRPVCLPQPGEGRRSYDEGDEGVCRSEGGQPPDSGRLGSDPRGGNRAGPSTAGGSSASGQLSDLPGSPGAWAH